MNRDKDGDVLAVIPARLQSQRLPRKPLVEIAGRPLIQWVWEQVRQSRSIDRILVATDSDEIAAACERFGAQSVMTRDDHQTGSDRIGEVVARDPAAVILNVQGDEPEIDPILLDRLVAHLEKKPEVDVGTASAPYPEGLSPTDPASVKVVADLLGHAMYFSRSPLPGSKSNNTRVREQMRLHVGVYAYRRDALERFLALPRSPLELMESLEQLRMLENGMTIAVLPVDSAAQGIDTPQDLESFRRRVAGG